MLRRGEDAAATHVLEVVAIATIMIASVAYVVTFDVPPVATEGQRDLLEQKTRDILAILNDTPVESTLGTNLLQVAIHECLQNDCETLRDHVDKVIPEGARWGMYLSTREGLYPIYAPREPPGEAVSARKVIEPAWSYQFLGLSQSVYNPLEDPVVVYGLPIYSGDSIHQGGSGLRITVEGERTDNAAYKLKGSASTRAVDSDVTPVPAATSVFFHDGSGTALATRDVTGTTLALGGGASGTPVAFSVRIDETGGGQVPAGTTLTIQIPQGWTATGALPANDADWTWISDANNKNGAASGSSVIARLDHAVTSGHVDFTFEATYLGDAPDYYVFAASLSSGAYAQAQLLARADDHATTPAYEVPSLAVSVPRPLGVGATTTWTLAAFSSDPVVVTRVEVAEDESRAIFDSVSGLTGGGSWSTDGASLVWTGATVVSHDTPLALTFSVTSSTVGGPASDRAPFVPSVQLGEYSGRLLSEVSPGLYRGIFLPDDGNYEGYDSSTGAGLREEHPASSSSVYRTTALPGGVNYEVGYVLGLRDSLFGSSVSAQDRTVAPGSHATLDVEVQSVMYELAALGVTPSIDAYIYPPWSGDDREPIEHIEIFDGTLASGGNPFSSLLDTNGDMLPDATDVGIHEVEVAIPSGWLYGPYVVEVRISWLETLVELIGTTLLTEDLVRSASVYDYFSVRPEGAQLSSSPLYDVHLVAWFEDWY